MAFGLPVPSERSVIYNEVTVVRAYLKESDHGERRRVVEELYDLLQRNGVHGATMFRGVMGFGPHGAAEADILHLAGNLPIIIEFFAAPDEAKAAVEAVHRHKTDLNIVCWPALIRDAK